MERERRPNNDDRLTYSDIGSDLRKIREEKNRSKKMGKLEKAGIALAVAATGAATIHEVADGAKLDRVAVVATSPEKAVTNPDFAVGSKITVSSDSAEVTGGNVRYSPNVIDPKSTGDSNLAKVDINGSIIEHPILVEDKSDPANGQWDKFMGNNGKTLYVNHQNLKTIENSSGTSGGEIEVTITKTSSHGVFGVTSDGQTIRVATVVESK